MPQLLAAVALLCALADHWTTYLCLRAPSHTLEVTEANPLAAWAFAEIGLVPGLLIDTAVTFAALVLIVMTPLVPRPWKIAAFCLLIATSGFAVANNIVAMHLLGLTFAGQPL